MIEDFPKNEVEFDRRFSSEHGCLKYLFLCRWPEGFVCTRCNNTKFWKSSRGLYVCRNCQHQHSVTAGTIFHGTRKPLALWFKALWWFSTQKSGVSAMTLQQMLGLGSYHTAWCWLQKLRTCTIFPDREKLFGQIEADECYLGGAHPGKRGRGAGSKCKVAIAIERRGRKLGRLRMQVIENCSADQLIPFATNNIAHGSRVTTDGWKGYSGLEAEGYVHHKVLQSRVEDKASVLPGVHLIASLVNRIMLGTFHGRFDSKYLQRYLDEYVFRFNRRVTKTVGKRFWRIMQQAVASAPIRNLDLTMPAVNVATT